MYSYYNSSWRILFSWRSEFRCRTTEETTIWSILMIFHQWRFRIVFNFICLFCISNRNKKWRVFWFILTFNISLKRRLMKLRLSCTKIFFNPLNIKIKPMLQYFRLSLKQVFYFRSFSYFSSEAIFSDKSVGIMQFM